MSHRPGRMERLFPERIAGVHEGLSPDEEAWLSGMAAWSDRDGGYHLLQATKPLTKPQKKPMAAPAHVTV